MLTIFETNTNMLLQSLQLQTEDVRIPPPQMQTRAAQAEGRRTVMNHTDYTDAITKQHKDLFERKYNCIT